MTNIVSQGYAGGREADMYPFPGYEWLIVLVAAVLMPAMIFGGLSRRGLASALVQLNLPGPVELGHS